MRVDVVDAGERLARQARREAALLNPSMLTPADTTVFTASGTYCPSACGSMKRACENETSPSNTSQRYGL
jgi:hypothetical protein